MKYIIYLLCWILSISTISCKKFLDEKSDAALAVPSTLADLQAILDNPALSITPALNNNSSDEYYLKADDWNSLGALHNQSYIWEPTTGEREEHEYDWKLQYNHVFTINTVLVALNKIDPTNQIAKWNFIKGQALFVRSYKFFQLAQLFADEYDASMPEKAGIPLRLTSDFNKKTVRSTCKETYEQIIDDLKSCLSLLPEYGEFKTRPNKTAVHALLARIYLQIGDYSKAKESASQTLSIYSKLMNYNDVPDIIRPFKPLNDEVIFHSGTSDAINSFDYYAISDSSLYKSYHPNDLRKLLFFEDINRDGTFRFEGNYNRAYNLFTGLAVDEIFLIRAECNIRLGDIQAGLDDLDTLLEKRWKTGTFHSVTTANEEQALRIVLEERRKELVNRGVRWGDLRRLNKDPRFSTTLQRVLDGRVYTLPRNDLRYTLLIPQSVIDLTGIKQNPR